MLDFDDFDPLDDILLSDEDTPKGDRQIGSKKESSGISGKNFEADNKKKKIFDELFGSTKEQAIPQIYEDKTAPDDLSKSTDTSKKTETNLQSEIDLNNNKDDHLKKKKAIGVKASNWLGLFEDVTDNLSQSGLLRNEANDKDDGVLRSVDNKLVPVDLSAERRKSDVATSSSSSAQNAFKKKTSQFKSLEIDLNSDLNDYQYASKQGESKDKDYISVPETQFKLSYGGENDLKMSSGPISINPVNKVNSELQTGYKPSIGISRRHGSAKNKDQVNLFVTPDTNPPAFSNAERKTSSTLPSWLGGETKNVDIDTRSELQDKIGNIENAHNSERKKIDTVDEETKTSEQFSKNQHDVANAPISENVNSLTELRKKQTELYSIVKHQVDLYSKHEKDIKEAALALITKQHENINSLVEMAVFPASTAYGGKLEINKTSSKTNEEDISENTINQFKIRIKDLELENADLEIKLHCSERKNVLQLTSLEEAYNQKIHLLTERENRLQEEIKAIADDYKAKLAQYKVNEGEIIQDYKNRIEYLQNERTADLKKIEELNNLIRNSNNNYYSTRTSRYSNEIENHITDDAELIAKEELLLKKEKQLIELQDDLNRQKIEFESRKSGFEEKAEKFDLNCVKEKINIEQQKKELRRLQMALQQKQELWQHEKDREDEYLSNYKLEIEDAKQNLLIQEKNLAKKRFELAAEKSRLEAFTQIEGIKPGRMADIIQARAEVQGAIDEARNLKSILENERKSLKIEEKKLKQKSWKLREYEEELSMKVKYVERLAERSNSKYEEGIGALRKVKKVEQELNGKMDDIAEKLAELQAKENSIIMEKMAMYKQRELLNKCRMEFDHTIVPASKYFSCNYPETFGWINPFSVSNNDVIDPKCLILKMKAEQNNYVPATDAASSS